MSCRRRLAPLATALVLSLLPLAACGSSDDSAASDAEMRSFEADNGTIEIPVNPERIVATGYAVPVLIQVDAPLVGISTWDRGAHALNEEDRATYDELTKISGEQASSTNYEAIAEVEPDLIIIGVPKPVIADVDLERLEAIAPVVAIGPQLPLDWRTNTLKQADAAGRADAMDESKAAYEARAEELKAEFATSLDGLDFGHVGAYGDVEAGTFQREFAGSWGTNIATDLGVNYYGEVAEATNGSGAVSETPSVEFLMDSLGDADVITYTLQPDGTIPATVQFVLDSELWNQLPAVQAGQVYGLRNTEAATWEDALAAINSIAETLQPLRSGS